jgi:hypothetical protein
MNAQQWHVEPLMIALLSYYISFSKMFFRYPFALVNVAARLKEKWINDNVDLSVLSQNIAEFFQEMKFLVSLKEDRNGFTVVASPRNIHGIAENITVKVSGSPNDFSVEFVAGSRSNSLVRIGSLLSLIGGGFLVIKGLDSLEKLEALEKNFWIYVHRAVAELATGK